MGSSSSVLPWWAWLLCILGCVLIGGALLFLFKALTRTKGSPHKDTRSRAARPSAPSEAEQTVDDSIDAAALELAVDEPRLSSGMAMTCTCGTPFSPASLFCKKC